jgi:hypothetical protein
MNPADRSRIEELLQDETRSYRSIGRELGISDWTVRKVARQLSQDTRPMRQRPPHSDETAEGVSPLTSWLVFGSVVGFLALAIWAGTRWPPPSDL